MNKRVLAPYVDDNGEPKDWDKNTKSRLTYPSNIWTDIVVPFWSMPENTDHPTQKPEKLIAKLILASSRPNGMVLDPFMGSGTTPVTACKLGRRYIGIEIDKEYCCWGYKRLMKAIDDKYIQGYHGQCFWERGYS